MNWLGKMIGLPEDFLHCPGGSGGGVIQTTSSESTLVCLLAARTRAIRAIQEDEPDKSPGEINSHLVAYCSDQVKNLMTIKKLLRFIIYFTYDYCFYLIILYIYVGTF